MNSYLLVALGGAAGSAVRYAVGVQSLRMMGPAWPYGTLVVNVVGGFLMGVLAGWLAYRVDFDQERWRVLLGVGLLGGFTTFSAFSLEVALMIERRAFAAAAGYSLISVIASVGASFAGLMLIRRVLA